MSDWYKYLFNIFEGEEEREDRPDPLTSKPLVKRSNWQRAPILMPWTSSDKCHKKGLSMKDSLAAFDAEIAKIPPNPGAASDPARS